MWVTVWVGPVFPDGNFWKASKKNAFGVRCNRNLCGSKLFLKVMKTAKIIRFPLFSGANDVTRTHDLLITNQLLYRLSYTSTFLTACTFYHMSQWMSTKKFDDYYLFSCMKKCRISAQVVDFFCFLSVVQNLHCYTPPKNTRCFRLSRPRRRSKFLHFRDNMFT